MVTKVSCIVDFKFRTTYFKYIILYFITVLYTLNILYCIVYFVTIIIYFKVAKHSFSGFHPKGKKEKKKKSNHAQSGLN